MAARKKTTRKKRTPGPTAHSRLDDILPGGPGPAEQKLLDACRSGEFAEISETRPAEPSDTIRIRAALLRFLALGGSEDHPLHERGLRLRGAWIEGSLDLGGADIARDFRCHECHFASVSGLVLADARFARNLDLTGSKVAGIDGDRVRVGGDVDFEAGSDQEQSHFESSGDINLRRSRVDGSLSFGGAKLSAAKARALAFDEARIGGSVYLQSQTEQEGGHRFEAKGEVRFLTARIDGQRGCTGARFESTNGNALGFDGAEIGGGVFLRAQEQQQGSHRFEAKGQVRFLGARILGNLECAGAKFESTNGDALTLEGARVRGSAFFRRGTTHPFETQGALNLMGTMVEGNLQLVGATLSVAKDAALILRGAKVHGELRLGWDGQGAFKCEGSIDAAGLEP